MMLNPVDPQNAKLLECPGAQALSELAVEGLGLLAVHLVDLGLIEPLVLQQLSRTEQHEAGRIEGLEGRDERELLAGAKKIVDDLDLLLGVVAVGGTGSADDRSEELAGAESGTNTAGEGNDRVGRSAGPKKVLHVGANGGGWGEKEDIVKIGCAGGIVVEMIDNEAGTVDGELDVEFSEERDERVRGDDAGAEGDEDVSVGV